MTDRIPLSRATSTSTTSSNDELVSLVEEPIRYIHPTICTKPSYNIIEDEINMNNYHQFDIHQSTSSKKLVEHSPRARRSVRSTKNFSVILLRPAGRSGTLKVGSDSLILGVWSALS